MSEELRQLFKYYEKTGLKRKQEHTFLYDLLPERIFFWENENEYLFHSIARQLELEPPLNWNYVSEIFLIFFETDHVPPSLPILISFSGWNPNLVPPTPTQTVLGPDGFATGKNTAQTPYV